MPKTKRAKKSGARPKNDENAEERSDSKLQKQKELVRLHSKLEDFKNAEARLRNDFEDEVIAEIKRLYAVLKMRTPQSVGNSIPTSPVRHSAVGLKEAVACTTASPSPRAAKPPCTAPRVAATRSSSHDRGLMMPPRTVLKHDRFRTPNCNMATGGMLYNVITPKVSADVPLTIVRRPRQGEVAFALTGSPLLVSSVGSNETANVIVPLTDGRVMSILPQTGLRREDMPEVDNDTMRQLLRLRDNIDLFLTKKPVRF